MNITPSSSSSSFPALTWILLSVLILISTISGSFLLSLVMSVVLRHKRVQSTTNFFILSLSGHGLLFLLFQGPILVTCQIQGPSWSQTLVLDILCRGSTLLLLSSVACNQTLLVAMSVDRFFSLTVRFDQYITLDNVRPLILGCLVLGTLGSCPCLMYVTFDPMNPGPRGSCSWNPGAPFSVILQVHLSLFLVLFYLVSFLIVGLSYLGVAHFVWRISRNSAAIRSVMIRRTLNYLPKAKIKIVRLLIVVTALDLVLMSIFFGLLASFFLGGDLRGPWNPLSLAALNFFSIVQKPLIYLKMHRSFRKGCLETLCCWLPWGRRRRGGPLSDTYRVTKLAYWEKRNCISLDPGHSPGHSPGHHPGHPLGPQHRPKPPATFPSIFVITPLPSEMHQT